MIADLPARWRREAATYDQLALARAEEGRGGAAHGLLSAATVYRDCADELIDEMGQALEAALPDDTQEEGTAHASQDKDPPGR